ncbi:hypothetical protein BLJ79_04115 [Arthrobacter sp. UCD-GKA]|uniref:hypothetical protein n=1 Tax=Arthrobacter sp. UCD-GKA TaxID=1913576 RepID=UPI0008DE3755|nr:hypothetical protein [Arthrobacter sp. UCD-GKA]OIH85987.1 hypothetical protein BLJ79_04115 [Arthrobacter sp. UCD-GKA]
MTAKPKPAGLVFNAGNHTYRLDSKPVRGVTGLIGAGIPKDNLIPWAAEVAGTWAMDHLDELRTMDRANAIQTMRMAWRKVRDDAGITGTAVHGLAEQLATTGEVEAPDELAGYIEGFADFLEAWQITPVLTERPCGNRTDHFGGTFDMLATSPLLLTPEQLADGWVVQVDLKTSKGVYGETALQTAAYSKAEFYVDTAGNEQPMLKVAKTYVAHVTPMDREGVNARYGDKPLGTTLYPLAGSPEEINEHYSWFLAAAFTAKTAKLRDKLAREPLAPPVSQLDVAA